MMWHSIPAPAQPGSKLRSLVLVKYMISGLTTSTCLVRVWPCSVRSEMTTPEGSAGAFHMAEVEPGSEEISPPDALQVPPTAHSKFTASPTPNLVRFSGEP